MRNKKIKGISTIKAWAVIDKDTNEIETFNNGQLAIWEDAGLPMRRIENFILVSGKVVPVEIKLLPPLIKSK